MSDDSDQTIRPLMALGLHNIETQNFVLCYKNIVQGLAHSTLPQKHPIALKISDQTIRLL
jgi:hypothetical protein